MHFSITFQYAKNRASISVPRLQECAGIFGVYETEIHESYETCFNFKTSLTYTQTKVPDRLASQVYFSRGSGRETRIAGKHTRPREYLLADAEKIPLSFFSAILTYSSCKRLRRITQ